MTYDAPRDLIEWALASVFGIRRQAKQSRAPAQAPNLSHTGAEEWQRDFDRRVAEARYRALGPEISAVDLQTRNT